MTSKIAVQCLEHPLKEASKEEDLLLAELLSNGICRKYFIRMQAESVSTKAQLCGTVLVMDDAEFRRRHAQLDAEIAVFQTLLSIENPRAPKSQVPSP